MQLSCESENALSVVQHRRLASHPRITPHSCRGNERRSSSLQFFELLYLDDHISYYTHLNQL